MTPTPGWIGSKDMTTFGAIGDSVLASLGLDESREDPCGDAMGPLSPEAGSTGYVNVSLIGRSRSVSGERAAHGRRLAGFQSGPLRGS